MEFRVHFPSTIHSLDSLATCFDLFVNTKHKVFTTWPLMVRKIYEALRNKEIPSGPQHAYGVRI